MQRYFIEKLHLESKEAFLVGNDFHHIKNVMRSKIGDYIIVCDNHDICFKSKIVSFENNQVKTIFEELVPTTELPVVVDIAQALIRRERFEYMLQKSTELGAHTIIPVKMKHSIVQLEDKKEKKKIERWNKITKEASEQSHRNHNVMVDEVTGLRNIDFKSYDVVLVAYEKENQSTALEGCLTKNIKRILVVIGPEGGFHNSEIDFLQSFTNVCFVGLGKRILRSETASSYILSVISFVYEMRLE